MLIFLDKGWSGEIAKNVAPKIVSGLVVKTFKYLSSILSFLLNTKLISAQKNYYFKNPVIESDIKQWCKETIWFGRRSQRFKCNPEKLEENTPQVKLIKTKFR